MNYTVNILLLAKGTSIKESPFLSKIEQLPYPWQSAFDSCICVTITKILNPSFRCVRRNSNVSGERSPFDGSCCSGQGASTDSDNEESISKYRVVLLGDSGVGKTALVSQFMTSEYINTYDASLGKFVHLCTNARGDGNLSVQGAHQLGIYFLIVLHPQLPDARRIAFRMKHASRQSERAFSSPVDAAVSSAIAILVSNSPDAKDRLKFFIFADCIIVFLLCWFASFIASQSAHQIR